ncbi:hypothetical protein [Vibrio fluvialis]|uniref:hypothetical protein n=1 Tax=Vibrio fluvialis TaxID=676 RepID=UPI001EEAD0CE|nr:hypothetical protein [Vibrio fluvialis]MCG6391813.1 hypothetical protein [Vibrio fluvialis]
MGHLSEPPMPKAPDRSKAHEYQHHSSLEESLTSQLCKLHVKVMCKGAMPKEYVTAINKVQGKKRYSEHDRALAELSGMYFQEFGKPNFDKPWLTVYQRNLLLAFAEFIDDPLRCHKGRLAKLQHCKSVLTGLQFKQRVALFKVVTTLFTATNIETGFIGRYSNKYEKEFPLLDEQGNEFLLGIQHYAIRSRYQYLWGQSISKTKYFDCLRMLKSSGFFEVTACYVSNTDAPVIKQELREKGASLEEIEAIPRVYSKASYKMFTQAFFDVFKEILNSEFMQNSKAAAVAKRIKNKLSLVYATYDCFGNSFVTRKNRFLARFRYPQGANHPPEFDPVYH